MGRKRLPHAAPSAEDEKENEDASSPKAARISALALQNAMQGIMCEVQCSTDYHDKYVKEMHMLYKKADHVVFVSKLIEKIKAAMAAEEVNDYAANALKFCALYISSLNGEVTHPVLTYVCNWLLNTTSYNKHIRFRLCQFINMVLNALGLEAALDDAICDRITESMLSQLRDLSANVRVQAVLALQRLQSPDNPDDPVIRAYNFHMTSDPSSHVRIQVITCIGRNYQTIPQIMERLWDVDEKVRRHTYVHMSSFAVRSLKVAQRLICMEQGLGDRSESVRKVVTGLMLKNWIEAYQGNVISLINAMKLDATEAEMVRFKKVTKLMLGTIFKQQSRSDLISHLQLETDGEFYRCIPQDKLTIEAALYWQCLVEHFMAVDADEYDAIVPELSAFCEYVERFCQRAKADMDRFDRMVFQFTVLSLMELLVTYDLGDEIGRKNLKELLTTMLKDYTFDEMIIEVIVKCTKNLIKNEHDLLEHFKEILEALTIHNAKQNDLVHDRALVAKLINCSNNSLLNIQISSLKVKILDLEEQEMNAVNTKNYAKAQAITDEKNAVTEEYTNLLKPLMEKYALSATDPMPLLTTGGVRTDSILQSLQIAFYMLTSTNWKKMDPLLGKVYNDLICRHIAAHNIVVRDWALKCATSYSMIYRPVALEVFKELHSQFANSSSARLWETAVCAIFELLDRHGIDHFSVAEDQNKTKRTTGRQLYSSQFADMLTLDDDPQISSATPGTEVLNMMAHIMTTCDQIGIKRAIVIGMGRLIVHGQVSNKDIIEKIFLLYFNPTTEPELHQTLSVFMDMLVARRLYYVLETGLVPTVMAVLSATGDSPLYELRASTITHFFIDATRTDAKSGGAPVHNKFAMIFLHEMLANFSNKELCRLLSKDILTLEVDVKRSPAFCEELKQKADELLQHEFESGISKNLKTFRAMLDGDFVPQIPVRESVATEDDTNMQSEINTEATVDSDIETEDEEPLSPITEVDLDITPCTPGDENGNIRSLRKSMHDASVNGGVAESDGASSSSSSPPTKGKEVLTESNTAQTTRERLKRNLKRAPINAGLQQSTASTSAASTSTASTSTASTSNGRPISRGRSKIFKARSTLRHIAEVVEEENDSGDESTFIAVHASSSYRNGQAEQSANEGTPTNDQTAGSSSVVGDEGNSTATGATSATHAENDEMNTSEIVPPSPRAEVAPAASSSNRLRKRKKSSSPNPGPQPETPTNVRKKAQPNAETVRTTLASSVLDAPVEGRKRRSQSPPPVPSQIRKQPRTDAPTSSTASPKTYEIRRSARNRQVGVVTRRRAPLAK